MNETKTGADDRAIQAQGAGALTKEQVRDLILAAQSAWRVQQKLGLADETFDVWRKAALHDATGLGSFRAVTQRDYGRALAYFLQLAGKKPEVRRAAAKPQAVDEAGRARWALDGECRVLAAAFGSEAGARSYAEALLGRIHRTTWHGATAKQLWQVLFTLRSRAKRRGRVGTR
jgi:hypothetical protein